MVKQVGSEYTARDKQIHIELKPIYKEVLSLVNSIKSEYNLIEPKKAVAMQGSFSDLDRISPLMGRLVYDIGTSLMNDPKARYSIPVIEIADNGEYTCYIPSAIDKLTIA